MIMKFIKTQLRPLLAAIICFIASHHNSYAGGFPVRPGSLLIMPSVNYFYANKGWDSVRHLAPFPNNGKFTSVSYSLYAEYGLSRRFTLVASLPYVTNTYEQTNFKSINSGFTDLETGIRYYIANINYLYFFTVQGTVITPLYNNPNLGYGQTGAEIKLAFAGSSHLFGSNSYFNLENGVRQYFGSEGPIQDRYSATFGLSLDKAFKNQLSVTFSGFYSKSDFKQFSPNPSIDKNFSFNQVSLTYGHSFSREFSVSLTAGKFINGRNTGDGTTGSVALILKPF
jgi:hypothetical protein